uniref:DH domain-containing protein n=1 Tax=Stomoxys calcitrans TaxID=35570 RepID=A0A1I8P6L1_STOCA
MSNNKPRHVFQRDRTFAKYESNQRRWSAINDDLTITNRTTKGHPANDEIIIRNISTSNSDLLDCPIDLKETKEAPSFRTYKSRFSSTPLLLEDTSETNENSPGTPEPALWGVKQKLLLFENINAEERKPRKLHRPGRKPEYEIRKFVSKWHMGHKETAKHASSEDIFLQARVQPKERLYAEVARKNDFTKQQTIALLQKESENSCATPKIAYISPSFNNAPDDNFGEADNHSTTEAINPSLQSPTASCIQDSKKAKERTSSHDSNALQAISEVVATILEQKSRNSSDLQYDRSNDNLPLAQVKPIANKSFLTPTFKTLLSMDDEQHFEEERKHLIESENENENKHRLSQVNSSSLYSTSQKDFFEAKQPQNDNDISPKTDEIPSDVSNEMKVLAKPINKSLALLKDENSAFDSNPERVEVLIKRNNKELTRNYASLTAAQTVRIRGEKYISLRPPQSDVEDEDHQEMYAKGQKSIQPILDELIKTEETYVESLWDGLKNYGSLFERKDLPLALKGKKYVLFCNMEQIAEFHRDEFLPMLQRNRGDLKQLFDEFQIFIEQNCFYCYVLYAINNQKSLELCDGFKKYFKTLQTECNDTLGINSFILQPIQRIARYPLLLKEFIKKLFDKYPLKPVIDSCCRLDKKFQDLLSAINNSEVINDLACLNETHEFNIFFQGKFRNVGEFNVHDHHLKRSYRSKVFAYDKCIIYTEIKRKEVVFRGRYPREHLGISTQSKSFTLFYNKRKQQECDFMGDHLLIKQWQQLILDIISAYASEERMRIKQLHMRKNGEVSQMRIKPAANLLLFRDSNRFSTDIETFS